MPPCQHIYFQPKVNTIHLPHTYIHTYSYICFAPDTYIPIHIYVYTHIDRGVIRPWNLPPGWTPPHVLLGKYPRTDIGVLQKFFLFF